MATKRVVLNGQTLIDLTLDTVAPEYVVQGKTFHGRDGEIYMGAYKPNIAALTITENGVYPIDDAVDGYGPITVEVTSGAVDPTKKPELLPPTLSIEQETSTLTITDTRNDNHTEEYDIYFNGAYFFTVHQHVIRLNVYATVEDVVEITAIAKSSKFNASVKSNTVLWWKVETNNSSSSSSSIYRLYTPSIFVNGAKKTLSVLSDSNTSTYTEGYRIFCNGEEITTTPFATKVVDISDYLDFSTEQYFQAQAYRKASQTYYNEDSYLSSKAYPAAPNEGTEGLAYTLTSSTVDPYYTCTGIGSAKDTEIIIPSYYEDIPVRYVGANAFQSNTTITKVVFSDNMYTLGNQAFQNCSALTEVQFSKSLYSVGEYCFRSTKISTLDISKRSVSFGRYALDTSSLKTLILGNIPGNFSTDSYLFNQYHGITSIYVDNIETWLKTSFSSRLDPTSQPIKSSTKIYVNGNELTDLVVPDSFTSIPRCCFYNYRFLNTVTTNNVATIGNYAFANSSVKSVFTSKKLTTLGEGAFNACTSLTNFDFQSGLLTIGSKAFQSCSKLVFYSLPNSLKTIGSYAFSDNYGLTKINLPNSITSIESQAFSNCTNLEQINVPVLLKTLSSYTFNGCSKLERIDLPWGLNTISSYAFQNCTELQEVSLFDNINTISDYAFYGCNKLQPFKLPEELLSIGSSAFENCSLWEEINIPDGVHTIGQKAFANCEGLREIFFGKSLLTLGSETTLNCRLLEKIEVHPENIAFFVEDGVLYSSNGTQARLYETKSSRTELTIREGTKSITASAFKYTTLKRIIFPESLTSIGASAFSYSEVEDVVFSNQIETIGASAFYASSLTKAILPDSLISLGASCFYNNQNLAEIRFGNNLSTIGDSCCQYCDLLEELYFPDSLTSIGASAFGQCSALRQVRFPNGTYSIGTNAFYKSFAQKGDIIFPGGRITGIGEYAFAYCNLTNFTLPLISSANAYVFQYADIDEIDMSDLTFGQVPSYWFERATVGKMILWPSCTAFGSYCFSYSTIKELVLLGKYPATYNSNCFNGTSFTKISISDFEDWLVTGTKYNNSSYSNYMLGNIGQKNLIDENRQTITSLTIPESITTWDARLTRGFRWVEDLTVGNHVTSLPQQAFINYYSLKNFNFNIPITSSSSVYQYGNFSNMGSWQEEGTTLILGDSVKGFPNYFLGRYSTSYSDNNIQRIDFTNATNFTQIGSYVGYYCYNLRELKLPDTLTSLSSYAFQYCYGLTKCHIPSSLGTIGDYAFSYCSKLQELIISEGVKTINPRAFQYCSQLTEIVFPQSLTTISSYAFQYCTKLHEITFLGPTSVGTYAFQYCDLLRKAQLSPCASLGSYCFYHCHSLEEVDLPESIVSVPTYAFQYCYALNNLNLKNVTTISSSAFQGCYGLRELDLKNVVTVGSNAFDSCHNIKTATLNASLTTINSGAFQYCYKLYEINNYSSLVLTPGATSYGGIAQYAKQINTEAGAPTIFLNENGYIFYKTDSSCTLIEYAGNDTDLLLPEECQGSAYTLSSYCFAGMSKIESITFPITITSIPIAICYQVTNLKEITIPEQITSLGAYAFQQCYYLNRVNFDAIDITSSNSYAFQDCGKYSEGIDFYIGEKVQTIPANLFACSNSDYSAYIKNLYINSTQDNLIFGQSSCSMLKSNKLSVHIKNIDRWLTIQFVNSSANPLAIVGTKLLIDSALVTELTVETQTYVNNYVFYGYDYLTKADLSYDALTYVGAYAFYQCPLQTIKLGQAITSIGDYAFNGNTCTDTIDIEYAVINSADKTSSSNVFGSFNSNSTVNLVIRNTVKNIPEYLFYNLTPLQKIEFETGCQNIVFGSGTFSGCTKVSTVKIDSLIEWLSFSFKSNTGNPIQNLGTTTLYINDEALTSLIIPQTITTINEFAFYRYSQLQHIELHKDVNKIASRALSYTPGLKSISVSEENEYFILQDGILYSKDFTQLVCASKSIISEIVVPSTITSIPSGAFYDITGLIEISLPDTLTSIGMRAFYGCSGLKKCNIPKKLTTLSTYAFYNCYNLEELNYDAEALPSLGQDNYIFYRCGMTPGLTVNFGKDVTSIPAYLFYVYNTTSDTSYRPKIIEVNFDPESICTSIGSYAFWRNPFLTSFTCPDSLTSIGQYSFYCNSALEGLTFSNNLTTIQASAFDNCTKLGETLIPYSVRTVGSRAFASCTAASFLCEAPEKPSGWDSTWNSSNRPVTWAYNGLEYTYYFVTNSETSIESITSYGCISLPALANEDKYFWGWYVTEDFSGTQYLPGQRVYGKELTGLTFYARWEDTPQGDGLSWDTAYLIMPDMEVTVNITVANQTKYYRFIPPVTGSYTFYASTSSRVRAYLYNSQKSTLTSSYGYGLSFAYSLTAGETYYFTTKFYSSSTTGSYIIGISR